MLNKEPLGFRHLLLFILIYSLALFATSALWGVIETSEARYSEISREMFRSSDLVHPHLLNIQHYHKPPVTYWITSFAYSLFGVNATAVRFFLTLAYVLQIIIVYRIALAVLHNQEKGFWAAFIYANLLLVLISVRSLTTDAFNNTFVLLTIWSALSFKQTFSLRWLYLTALFAGLSFLTKGPIVVIMLVPVYFFARMQRRESAKQPSLIHYAGALVLFGLTGFSWFMYLVLNDTIFFDYFVMRHFVDRFVNAEVFTRHKPWYFYLLVFPTLTLPWFLPFITRLSKTSAEGKGVLLGWVAIPLIIFSAASSKLVLYILPLSAGFALVTADVLWQMEDKWKLPFSIIYLIILSAFVAVPFFEPSVVFTSIMYLIIFIGIAGITFIFFYFRQSRTVLTWATAFFTVILIFFSAFLIKENSLKFNTLSSLASFIKENKLKNRNILIYDRLTPSLAFELDKPIISLYHDNSSLKRETQFEKSDDWRAFYYDLNVPADSLRLQTLMQEPSVLVVKGVLKQKGLWLNDYYTSKKEFPGWTIFY